MALPNISEDEFRATMREWLTPARAISKPQHLRGRETKLRQIDRAFNSPGKHVFIFGDRGVGKTSLAQSAASIHQSSDAHPILVACGQDSTFFRLIHDIAKQCLPTREMLQRMKRSETWKAGFPGLSLDVQKSIDSGMIPDITSINDAIAITKYVSLYHSKDPIIIIDEFDQLVSDKERKFFADYIKQVSDQGIGVKMIFCGIGSSLENLIGVHLSTGRYMSEVGLERLSHDALWSIVNDAATALNVTVDRETLIRIGLISDGFPYYAHLIAEQLFWNMFDDSEIVSTCKISHYLDGVKRAVAEAQSPLRLAYEKATQKYSDDYQEVLWALADKAMLRRQVTEVYEQSYVPIMRHRPGRALLEKKHFLARMNNLKSDRHGFIVEAHGAGWYQYRENIVRGYVRLQAENQGIQLGADHHLAPT